LFLKLNGTPRRDGFEMIMKTRNARSDIKRQIFNDKRLIQMITQLTNGADRLLKQANG
jgi:hypothetical protein